MKNYLQFLLISLIFLMGNCNIENPEPVNILVDAGFSERTSQFSFDFIKELEKEESKNNFFVSPLSLHMALGMLLNGSDNTSREELIKTLKMEGMEMELINKSYLELIEKLPEVDPLVVNKLANSVWQRNGFNVEDNFKSTLKEFFSAEIYEEDFSQETVEKINQWASNNTNDKIKEILKEISADQVMFLINALYFKGDWALQFDKKKTTEEDFHGVEKVSKVDMMAQTDTFSFAQMGEYDALDMPYGNGKYAMRVVLPKDKSLTEIINGFTIDSWNAISSAQLTQKVDLKMPKLKMDYEKKLNTTLINMGMPSLFTSSADLSKISPPAGKIKVGLVKQNSFVAIDEEGTEAAVVTTIGIELTSVPNYPLFHVDKPFLFFIYERTSGTIQFVGKILDLEK